MNYFYQTKEHLKRYRFYKANLRQMYHKKAMLMKPTYTGSPGVANYDTERVQTSHCYTFTPELGQKVTDISTEIQELEMVIKDIDNGLEELSEVTRRIIEMKYIGKESYSWPSLVTYLNLEIDKLQKQGKKVDYISETTARRWAKEAIYHVAICIYGLEANGQILDRKAQ